MKKKIDVFRLVSNLCAYAYIIVFILGNIVLGAKTFMQNNYMLYTLLLLLLFAVFFAALDKPVKKVPSVIFSRSAGGLLALAILASECLFMFQRLKVTILFTFALLLSAFFLSFWIIRPRRIENSVIYSFFIFSALLTLFGGLFQILLERVFYIPSSSLGIYGILTTLAGLLLLMLIIFKYKVKLFT